MVQCHSVSCSFPEILSSTTIDGSKRCARDTPRGPNYFIFMQFSATNGSWRPQDTPTVGDLGGGSAGARIPLRPEILLVSCSFLENLAISYFGAPPWTVDASPTGNPGSAPVLDTPLSTYKLGRPLPSVKSWIRHYVVTCKESWIRQMKSTGELNK